MSHDEQNAPNEEPDRALGELGSEELFHLKEEVHKMADELGIPVEEATRMAYEEKGIRVPHRSKLVGSIEELVPDMKNISLKARIISLRRLEKEDGDPFFRGLLGDSSGEIRYICWVDFPFKPDTAIFLQNVSTRTWNDELELVINDYSFVSVIEDTEGLLPKVEDGVPSAISELSAGDKQVDIEVRVVEVRELKVRSKGRLVDITKGTLADRTGRLNFTCWGPVDLNENGCYRIIGGYIKEFRGMMDLNLSPGSLFKPLPEDRLPPADELMMPEDSRVVGLLQGRFSGPVVLRGVILSVRPGSGIYKKCDVCGRRLTKGQCTVHGRNEGEMDLGLKCILDDGSGTALLKGDRSIVEEILSTNMEKIKDAVKDRMDTDWVLQDLTEKLLGRPVTVVADPILDDYGLILNLSEIENGWDTGQLEREIISLMEVMA
ncbi:MAG: hypothetical protein R6V01_09645 [Thermoplasmatota archaeon]